MYSFIIHNLTYVTPLKGACFMYLSFSFTPPKGAYFMYLTHVAYIHVPDYCLDELHVMSTCKWSCSCGVPSHWYHHVPWSASQLPRWSMDHFEKTRQARWQQALVVYALAASCHQVVRQLLGGRLHWSCPCIPLDQAAYSDNMQVSISLSTETISK